MAAPTWAISFTECQAVKPRHQRSLEGSPGWPEAEGAHRADSRQRASTRMPASRTALVSSSTNSGFPSVLATICFITSVGSARPLATCVTILSTFSRSSRPSVKVPTLARPAQGGSNSGRKVTSARIGSWRTRSTMRSSSSKGGVVGPLRVLYQQQDWLLARMALELIEQRRERPAALLRRAKRQLGIPVAERDR